MVDHIRHCRHCPETLEEGSRGEEPERGHVGGPPDIAIDLGKALGQLPVEQRNAFLLYARVGMTVPEIADVLQENEETVKSRIRYACKKLKGLLRDYLPSSHRTTAEDRVGNCRPATTGIASA